MLLELQNVGVEILDVLYVRKDKGLLRIKTESDNILDVGDSHLNGLLKSILRSVEILLIVSNLDNYRNIESFLEVSGEDERNSVAQMESLS